MHKHRKKRWLAKKCVIYCEGQTELHYIKGLKRWVKESYPTVEILLEPIDVKGGGYADMLKKLRKEPDSNCVARIALIDFDRFTQHPEEKTVFEDIVETSRSSIKKRIPIIVIASNENFEYVICCHDPNYKKGQTDSFLRQHWNYASLDEVKEDERIWDACNRGKRSLEVALSVLDVGPRLVENSIKIKIGKASPIELSAVKFEQSYESCKCSNFADLAKIAGIEW